MNRKRGIAIIALALVVAGSLLALPLSCGGSSDQSQDSQNSQNSPDPPPVTPGGNGPMDI